MKHSSGRPDLTEAIRALGLDVPPESVRRLEHFEALLLERALPLGIVAASDASRLRERHLLDCLRALAAVAEEDADACDIGSGAGLPGVILAIARPDLQVGLVEPRRTRAAFLELALERLEVRNASVLPMRIEDVDQTADLCFARAFAPIRRSWEAARPRLRPAGRLVFFAGVGATEPGLGLFPGASAVRVLDPPLLESSGPLIIMTR